MTFVYYLFALPITLLGQLFGVLNLVMPSQFFEYLQYFISQMYLMSGIFPVDTLLTCLTIVLTWWIIFYGVEIILWLLSMLPWVKVPHHLPNHEIPQDQRNSGVVNLKGRNWLNLRK